MATVDNFNGIAVMADVFISYSHKDRIYAKQLADVLEKAGLTLWWDRELYAGQDFGKLIKKEIKAATAVIVMWSKDSVESDWVRGEASFANELKKEILPIKINDCNLPINFHSRHTPEVFKSQEEFEKLIEQLQSKINQVGVIEANIPLPDLKQEMLRQISSDHFWSDQWDQMSEVTKESYRKNYVKGNEFGKRHPLLILVLVIAIVALVYQFLIS